jgi:uncharacterized protein YbaR (Trm112 family)
MGADGDIQEIAVRDELHTCAACGYERGFHVSFRREEGCELLTLVLICPNCGARYDIGKAV